MPKPPLLPPYPVRQRRRYAMQGQVQGVGFRPFVYALAHEHGLTGFVQNAPEGVLVEVQGPLEQLDAFARDLETRLPPLARVTAKREEPLEFLEGEEDFAITASLGGGSGHAVLVSPDMALCPDCLADMRSADDRRFLYPFTNCTNCGPRYTITRSIPYDRAFTSMACFPMCPDCRKEYENPANRRFHAQPNACPACGPRLWFVTKDALDAAAPVAGLSFQNGPGGGPCVNGSSPASAPADTVPRHFSPQSPPSLLSAARLLRDGGILALKGLGGFHLACDALNEEAVVRLRRLKERPHKPFALMTRDVEVAGMLAHVGPEEEALLTSPEHPVVLCRCRDDSPMAPSCSPDTALVGLMLPYTPLHEALFAVYAEETGGKGRAALVMTSGNAGGQPICLGNREALAGLKDMADAFLLHDRDILIRVDDSVVCPLPERGPLFFRRARGYVPRPVPLGPFFTGNNASYASEPQSGGKTISASGPGVSGIVAPSVSAVSVLNTGVDAFREFSGAVVGSALAPTVLGVGAELKNTFCLIKGADAFVSQHVGDMGNLETAVFHARMIEHMGGLLQVMPEAVVRDLHPNFLSSLYAEESGLPVLRLQHHYAHAHAVLAEHHYLADAGGPPALVLALDGTGLGEDGALWGGELLFVHVAKGGHGMGGGKKPPEHARLGHLAPMPLPGGDAAVREPWRIAHALLEQEGLLPQTKAPLPWLPEYEDAARLLPTMLARQVNTPYSTSCGRLFDAVAALLGLCSATTYEGQAAIRLEEAQFMRENGRNSALAGSLFPPGLPCSFYDDSYPFPLLLPGAGRDVPQLDTRALFRALWADRQAGTAISVIARRFHGALAEGFASLAAHAAREHGLRHVGLSGGCLQNRTLALLLARRLEQRGLTPLLHTILPPNDGCISLGQACWGRLALGR